MRDVDWNAIGRILVSMTILGVAGFLLVVQPTESSTAIALSLVSVVAGFWLHVLPVGPPPGR